MAISNEQYALWLQRDTKRAVLAELKSPYESGGALAEGTVYLSSGGYATQANETPPSQPYRDVILGIDFGRDLDVNTLGGQSKTSVSNLKLNNADGEFDFLLDKVIDGWEVEFYLGDPTWARADFRLALVAVSEWAEAGDEKTITVKMRDKRLLLDREIKGDPVGGSGPNETKYLPLLWGSHQNLSVTEFIYDTATLVYSVVSNYNASSKVRDVRDSGLSLSDSVGGWSATAANTTVNAGTDTLTFVGHGLAVNDVMYFFIPGVFFDFHDYWAPFPGMTARPYWVIAAGLTLDDFRLSLTKGGAAIDITGTAWSDAGDGFLGVARQRWYDDVANTGRIQLSSPPVGRVTLDILNRQNYTSPFALAKELIDTYGNVTAGDIDAAAFTAADVTLDAKVALGYSNLAVLDRKNLLNVLDELIDSCFGWFGGDNLGLITCGLVDPSGLAAATATRTLTATMLMGDLAAKNLPPTVSRVNVNYQVNITVQSDGLVAAVTDADRTKYGAPFGAVQRSTAPSGTAYATNRPLYHKAMTEGEPRTAAAMNTSAYGTDVALPIANMADEIVEDRRPHLRVFSCETGIETYAWKLGDVVSLTHSRYGLSAGKNCRLVGIGVDLVKERVRLTLLTYAAPDVTTASYP